MKTFPRLAVCLWLAPLLFLSGCAQTPQKSHQHEIADYTDDDSGIVLPGETDTQRRVLLDNNDSDTGPVTARYSSQINGLYMDTAVRILPAFKTTPDQVVATTVRSVEGRDNFVQTDYRGQHIFGSSVARCTECRFDRSDSADPVLFKIVVVPHGNYLICSTFLVHPEDEERAQPYIDSFIQTVYDDSSKKKVLMTPVEKQEDEGGVDEADR